MQLLPLLMHSSFGQRVSSESSLLGLTQKKDSLLKSRECRDARWLRVAGRRC